MIIALTTKDAKMLLALLERELDLIEQAVNMGLRVTIPNGTELDMNLTQLRIALRYQRDRLRAGIDRDNRIKE